ncbi:hypothetical protein ASC89_09385 [Devosia sp. Root413D1]|uniref:hypothetical protein n=1 Tax=unclassified Devosia TaxID=196773 RepID=UPI0006F9507B|nr:hypothetical protein [Devosia sp. Root413D1]KQW80295.1 hypothetical protein ASC89_09385 [Devosia sp. Root413D1]
MRTRIAALTVTLLAALVLTTIPASAAGLDGMGEAIFGNSFNFSKANIEKAPVKAIGVGKLTVQLQRTKLKDVQKAFGGTIRREGDGTGRADWLCYGAEGANVWFISNALGGYEFVMMVAAEAASKPSKSCDAAPAGLTAPNFGIPGLGASTAELKATFGAASGSKIAYRSDRPGGYSDIAQYIGYLIKGGKVAGIGIGETSVQTAH